MSKIVQQRHNTSIPVSPGFLGRWANVFVSVSSGMKREECVVDRLDAKLCIIVSYTTCTWTTRFLQSGDSVQGIRDKNGLLLLLL